VAWAAKGSLVTKNLAFFAELLQPHPKAAVFSSMKSADVHKVTRKMAT
jgi:hypothetical protein